MDVLSYHVFDGRMWLADDEHSWTNDFHGSASFMDAKLAQDIGEREARENRSIYVMGCLGWQS
jgi:hypothetical protein